MQLAEVGTSCVRTTKESSYPVNTQKGLKMSSRSRSLEAPPPARPASARPTPLGHAELPRGSRGLRGGGCSSSASRGRRSRGAGSGPTGKLTSGRQPSRSPNRSPRASPSRGRRPAEPGPRRPAPQPPPPPPPPDPFGPARGLRGSSSRVPVRASAQPARSRARTDPCPLDAGPTGQRAAPEAPGPLPAGGQSLGTTGSGDLGSGRKREKRGGTTRARTRTHNCTELHMRKTTAAVRLQKPTLEPGKYPTSVSRELLTGQQGEK
ncbi:serine/arginine repetitive matrix protein 1-like [Lutra lutra]|uniref:serine/arginine repetitive matrix protein 1-like n=1 Tax=Lutra lutra TaxID=9657 RepID=UPI001FD571CF|nr:serine/arginine repetitive matrix protein 1-like [Lutra lutra]